MSLTDSESLSALTLPAASVETPARPAAIEQNVLNLFDACAPALMRYVASFGLNVQETEDIVQEAFLLLFRHLRLGRPDHNLRGWLFQVAHNLALRQRRRLHKRPESDTWDESVVARHIDPSPNPEAQMASSQRRQRLRSVLQALPARDRRCLSLRAEGLRYREIASALGMSLGAVAKSVARSMARLVRVDQR